MKLALHYSIIFSLLILLPVGLKAQENEHKILRDHSPAASPTDTEIENNEQADVDTDYRDSNPPIPQSYSTKDSIATKNLTHKAKGKFDHRNTGDGAKNLEKQPDEKEENESILSFNFIYYIFRKFKLSDIVDR